MWTNIVVNMTNGTVEKKPVDEYYEGSGGRALVARFLTKEVPPACDPLGAENALVFCTGVFAGTAFSTGHRVSVGCKSPLTGGAKESNVGGTLGQYFAEQGIRMISVFGIPKTGLYFLHIDKDGGVKLLDASEYKEKGTYAVTESLQKRYGENIAVAVIGQAGERKYKAASIQVSTLDGGHPCRAAGRGGTGAVMGSKGLKAVVVEKAAVKYKPKIADENKFNETLKTLTAEFVKWSQVQPVHLYGTVCYVEGMGPSALMPVQNFSGKIFKDWKKVGVEAFMKNIQTRGGKHQRPCQAGCIIQCSNVYNGPDGKYLTGGFEYETIALFGPNCMISDLDKIAQMDYICDDVGVDTMDVGDAVAVAMDCGKLKWGDADGVIALLEEIRKGTEFGAVLGSGCEATGLKLGAKRIPVVKHQGISGYEPRACLSVGVTYATTPQGADHTAGPAMKAGWDDLGRGAATMISRKFQIGLCMYDSFACLMLAGALSPRMAYVAQLYAAMYGGAVDPRRLQVGLGARCITEELAFNKKAGFTLKDDDLPEFFKTDRAPATGSRWAIPRYEIEEMFHF